jgi:hypothetical protein
MQTALCWVAVVSLLCLAWLPAVVLVGLVVRLLLGTGC